MRSLRKDRLVRALTLGLALAALPLVSGWAAGPEREIGLDAQSGLTLTIYNQDLALVSERRQVDFAAGENHLALVAVSRGLRPETVILSGAGLRLVEQAFQADLLTPRRLLERALGERVWVRRVNPTDGSERYLEGTLLSIAGQPLVRLGERLEAVNPNAIAFETGTGGLRAQPTLTAILESEAAGPRPLGLSYLTGGLSWSADYVAQLNAAEDKLQLAGLVTLSNNSGTKYRDAALRLVAGSVNQVRAPVMAKARVLEMQADVAMASPPDLAEQPIGEQRLYSLDRRVTLDRRETKQVTLLTAGEVAVVKEYRFEQLVNAFGGAEEIGPVKARVILQFENDEASGLGRPLPAGVVRVYQALPEGDGASYQAPVFIGEDRIGHTAKGERLRLTTGEAFDVTGRARRTLMERLSNKSYETGQVIMIKNAKDQAITAKLVGQMPPGWRMMEESQAHLRETANRIAWSVTVPAGGEARLSYRVRVTRP